MRLLVDANLSPRLATLLTGAGHDVTHVAELGLGDADDDEIMARALADDRAVVTADTDFVTMLALTGAPLPSVILLRRESGRRVEELGALLEANLEPLEGDVAGGCIVVIEPARVRVRPLPVEPGAPRKTRGNPRTPRHEAVLDDPAHPW